MLPIKINKEFGDIINIIYMYHTHVFDDFVKSDYSKISEFINKIQSNNLFFGLFGATIGMTLNDTSYKTNLELNTLIIHFVSLVNNSEDETLIRYGKIFTYLKPEEVSELLSELKQTIQELKDLNVEIANNPEYKNRRN